MSWREFNQWLAFDKKEPIDIAHAYMAQIAAVVANAFRSKGRPAQLQDFLLRTPEPQSEDHIKRQLVAFAKAHNASIGAA